MKPGQGCWTCKGRKIGCDRQSPACGNCLRTGRHCQGYGVRLAWPDKHDGRRKTQELSLANVQLLPHSVNGTEWQFLNVTIGDITASPAALDVRPTAYQPRSLAWWPDLEGQSGHLLSYYENRIAGMISTVKSRNGFREELLPWALSQSGDCFTALRNAMMAVSALHKFGAHAAMPFKTKALRALSQSFAADEVSSNAGAAQAQMASAMMLCVYSVFDETEENWHLHLNGAKSILSRNGIDSSFLRTWFLYHEVLGAFSSSYLERCKESPTYLAPEDDPNLDQTEIIGSLGCSLEVLEVIRCANFLRDAEPKPDDYEKICVKLEAQLLNLAQHVPSTEQGIEEYRLPAQRSQILCTAELYRMAALLYLRRVSPEPLPGETEPMRTYKEMAYRVLGSLSSWTSPWPLYVLACEAESDEHRMAILTALRDMDERRKIGNVFVLRTIIESMWKKRDLQADTGQPWAFKWWDPKNIDTNTPWFI